MASAPYLQRDPRRIIEDLVSGRVEASCLSIGQAWKVSSAARARTRAHQDRIRALVGAGRRRTALKEQRRFINSLSARLTAASKAVRVKRTEMATHFAEVWRVAHRIGYGHQPDTVWVRRTRNARDRIREICEFYLLDKAQQHLLGFAITPFFGIHPSQFSAGRGRSAAVEELLLSLTNATEDSVCIITDIRRFFDNVDHQWLEENLPLPVSLIRSTVHNGGLHLRASGRGQARLSDVDIERMGQRGIPQGSALSAIVAEWVIGELLRSCADPEHGAVFISYSDNMATITVAEVADRLINALRVGFRSHPAGPFDITVSKYPVGKIFRFLGYDVLKTNAGGVRAFVDSDIADERISKFRTLISECSSDQIIPLLKKIAGYCAAFPAWDGAADLKSRAQAYAVEEQAERNALAISSAVT